MPKAASKLLTIVPFDVITHTGALLTDIVRKVVDQPNRVSLTTLAEGGNTLFVITVTARDFARILGVRGRTLQSLRNPPRCHRQTQRPAPPHRYRSRATHPLS